MGKAICAFAVAAIPIAAAGTAHAGNGTAGSIKAERPPQTNKATSSPVVRDHRGGPRQSDSPQTDSWGNGTVRDHRKPVVELHFP